MTVPYIDLERIAHGDADERERLRRAASETGAFVLRGHGIDRRAALDVLDVGRRFFGLPREQLDAIDMVNSPFFRGYSQTGSERTQGRADLREQLDVGPEEEPLADTRGMPPYVRLRGPNLWPAALPALRPAILAWMSALRGLSATVLAHVLDVSGMRGDAFASGFAGCPHERLKIIRYPGMGEPDSTQGVGEHRDTSFLSIIVHDGTAGLEVHDGERFVDVPAASGELIFILGNSLRNATRENLAAALHRVTRPPAGTERVSVAYFFNPRLDFADYGVEALDVVLRSHPHVAQRYFADLVATAPEPTCA